MCFFVFSLELLVILLFNAMSSLKDVPGDVIRKICRFSSQNALDISTLQRINKQFYDQLSYNQPLMNIVWENMTRINFGDQIPKKLKAKRWNKLYKHYHDKNRNTKDVEIDIDKIEIAKASKDGLPNGIEWDFPCNLSFEDMKTTHCDTVRFCNKCSKHVYEVDIDDRKTLYDKINMGVCVAITNRTGYEINGKWYKSKPPKQGQSQSQSRTKSKWKYNGHDWVRL